VIGEPYLAPAMQDSFGARFERYRFGCVSCAATGGERLNCARRGALRSCSFSRMASERRVERLGLIIDRSWR